MRPARQHAVIFMERRGGPPIKATPKSRSPSGSRRAEPEPKPTRGPRRLPCARRRAESNTDVTPDLNGPLGCHGGRPAHWARGEESGPQMAAPRPRCGFVCAAARRHLHRGAIMGAATLPTRFPDSFLPSRKHRKVDNFFNDNKAFQFRRSSENTTTRTGNTRSMTKNSGPRQGRARDSKLLIVGVKGHTKRFEGCCIHLSDGCWVERHCNFALPERARRGSGIPLLTRAASSRTRGSEWEAGAESSSRWDRCISPRSSRNEGPFFRPILPPKHTL